MDWLILASYIFVSYLAVLFFTRYIFGGNHDDDDAQNDKGQS